MQRSDLDKKKKSTSATKLMVQGCRGESNPNVTVTEYSLDIFEDSFLVVTGDEEQWQSFWLNNEVD
jgi:hypothetical protein